MLLSLSKTGPSPRSVGDHPLVDLPREDLDLVAELVLQSGSLKGVAASYRVSYPTIRGRLNKVIDRLRKLIDGTQPDPLADLLADLVERGELTLSGARAVRDLARSVQSGGQETKEPR